MIRMPAVPVLFAIAAAVGAAAPPIAVAQSFDAGRTVKVSDYEWRIEPAGNMRVPWPAAGMTDLVTGIGASYRHAS